MKTKVSIQLMTVVALLVFAAIGIKAHAQEYVSAPLAPQTGRSPGVKIKLLSNNSDSTKTYILVFAPGDEVLSGLYEFAVKYHVKSARFTGIGDATTARIGWFDRAKKMFKLNVISTQSEITSLLGDIALYNGKPVVHAHINLAAEDGSVRGGHLLEAFVAPTLEVMVTVEPNPLYKKFNTSFGGVLIDPEE